MTVINPHVHTEQEILNSSFDETFGTLVTIPGVVGNGAVVREAASYLSGASANGTRELTSANTWYAVPSTVPTSPYVLEVAIETAVGTVRWGYDNTGTPSATNGLNTPPEARKLGANQVIYMASSSALDSVTWTTKII